MVTPRYTAAEAVVVHDDFYVGKTTRTRNIIQVANPVTWYIRV